MTRDFLADVLLRTSWNRSYLDYKNIILKISRRFSVLLLLDGDNKSEGGEKLQN